MTERTLRDRLHALGPLVLRVGIAVVLLQDGLQRTGVMSLDHGPATVQEDAADPSQAAAVATADGVQLNADWLSLLGMGELAVAGLFLLGLGTRLVAIPMLAVLGYGLFQGFPQGSLPHNPMVMSLLGVACLSLLVSGGGAVSLGRMMFRRRVYVVDAPQQPPTRDERRQPDRFVCSRGRSWLRHLKDGLGRINPFGRRAHMQVSAPPRRWGWGR